MLEIKRVFEAYLDELDSIVVLWPKQYEEISHISLQDEGELLILQRTELTDCTKYECRVPRYVELGRTYIVTVGEKQTDLQIGAVIRTPAFDEAYYYSGTDLGVTYDRAYSRAKVWAPTATAAKTRLYREGNYYDFDMTRQPHGVWSVDLWGDWEGEAYTFLVYIDLVWREAVDPYAKAASTNGLHGIIIDMEKTKEKDVVSLPPLQQFTDAIIYEAHIRDVTISPASGAVCRGQYVGLSELGTTGPNGTSTGLSHIKELGITHLELLPFNDFGGVDERNPHDAYNWGYNPMLFNVPEGSYAVDPAHPYSRIMELKRMIHTIHSCGIRVVMDVVYNHVYIKETSSFEQLVPGYYFRYDENGMPSNGTGVGNDIASERKMVRKFIVDSVLFWCREYNIDGFRFDLMGILDCDTMNLIRTKLDEVNPEIIMLGEGWDLQTALSREKKATLYNAAKLPRIAQFNDVFRDNIKGSTFDRGHRGYAFGSVDKLEVIRQVMLCNMEPIQSIHYVESHDNYTMWDKLWVSNQTESEETWRKRHRLATVMTLLSQGIPFLHAGQEFFRTKQGVENSYRSPDSVNQLDWERKAAYEDDVAYIRGVIALRKMHGAFRFPTRALIQQHVAPLQAPSPVLAFHFRDIGAYGPWQELVLLFQNSLQPICVALPTKAKWHVLADEQYAGVTPTSANLLDKWMLPPIGIAVLGKRE